MIHAPRYLGLDMGGTTVKVGALDAIGGFEPFGLFPTPALDDAEQCARFVEDVAYLSACHAVLPEDVRAIGIAIPGVADEQGCVSLAPNVSLDLKRVLAAFSVSFPTAVLAVSAGACSFSYVGHPWHWRGCRVRD